MDEMGPRWPDFFIAEVGATAALTGLIIVAVSINLQRILAIKYLPGRALEALMLLMAALLIASVALIPAQRLLLLGCEILLIEGVALLTSVVLQMQAMKADIPRQGRGLVAPWRSLLRGYRCWSAAVSSLADTPRDSTGSRPAF
jgi:hypothetical protein